MVLRQPQAALFVNLRRIPPDLEYRERTSDLQEMGYWKDYIKAYEDCLTETSTAFALDPIAQQQDWVHTRRMVTLPIPTADEIRDYANHLYVQRGSVNGHDRDDWLEAEACLAANIPKESSRTRIHHHTQITERAALPLVKHGRS